MKLPDRYPELLAVLVVDIQERLLQPGSPLLGIPQEEVCRAAFLLAERTRMVLGGLRPGMLRKVPASELATAEPETYGRLGASIDEIFRPWVESEFARQALVWQVFESIRTVFRGGFRIPRGRSLHGERDDEMFASFKGDYKAVAAEFGMSDERARQIINARIAAERTARQSSLFE